MKQTEFNNLVNNYGISLRDAYAVAEKKVLSPMTLGIFRDNSEWVVYDVGERGDYYEFLRGQEDEAYQLFYSMVLSRLKSNRYITKAISEHIIYTPKEKLFAYWRSEYNMNEQALQQAWDYLRQDFHVLNEVKYYVVNGEFVPEKYAYKVQGYSAQHLFETTYLDVLGAFNYLIYLKRKPKEALADLKAGLPRK